MLKTGVALFAAGMMAALGAATSRHLQSDIVREIMEQKLDRAHALLEAVIFEDLEAVEANAAWLSLLAEAAEWHVHETPEYLKYSSDFFRTVGALSEAGRNRDLDGAASAYAEMTLKCVQCHKYTRGVRRVSSPAE